MAALHYELLHQDFGVRATGIDLRQPNADPARRAGDDADLPVQSKRSDDVDRLSHGVREYVAGESRADCRRSSASPAVAPTEQPPSDVASRS